MSDNRYRPPASEVGADVPSGPALLNVAALLLAGTLVLGFISTASQWQFLRSQGPVWFVLLVTGLTTSLVGWLSYKVWKGRNWARILMLVLFIGGTFMSFPQLPALVARSPVTSVIFVLQALAQFAALYIVFLTPARHCFSKSARSLNKPLQSTREDARA